MSELNIEHYVIVGGGDAEDTDVPTESIAETLELVRGNWIWFIVKDEDNKAYNCDILMDKMLLDEQRKTKEDYESDMVYFGISDKTRKESIDFLGRYNAITMNSNTQNYGKDLPDCEEDYNK